MTRLVKKSVKEFLESDGWSIKAKNLNDAAASFSDQQQGCCPRYEVYSMFRLAIHDGTLLPITENHVVVGYRAQTEFERDQAAERSRHRELHEVRRHKDKAPSPHSRRLNPLNPKIQDQRIGDLSFG
jgi:hypothetical protein